jgi:pullulanase
MDRKKNFHGSQKKILRTNRLAAAINFCCQGRPFFLAGEEFARTKDGIKNSYCSDSSINQLDWTRAWKNRSLVDYYRGLINLRQQLPALCDKSAAAGGRILWVRETAPNCVAICMDNTGGDSRWSALLLIFNCTEQTRSGHVPPGTWQLLSDGDSSFHWQENTVLSGVVEAAPMSVLILGKQDK